MKAGTLLGSWPDGSPEWHEARRWRVGGSDIGPIMGWSPFASRDDIMAVKLSGDTTSETKAMQRGSLLEPSVLAWGAVQHGYAYQPAGTFLHPRFDWMLFNPDGITEDLVIESKTTTDRSNERGWGRAGTDQVPLGYRAQVAWGMAVLDKPEAHILVLDGAHNGRPSLSFSRYIVQRDRALETRLIAEGLRFITELKAKKESCLNS